MTWNIRSQKQLSHCDLVYHFLLSPCSRVLCLYSAMSNFINQPLRTEDKQSHHKKHVDKRLSSQDTVHWAAFPKASISVLVSDLPRTCCILHFSFHQSHPGWWHTIKTSETNQWMALLYNIFVDLSGDWWQWIQHLKNSTAWLTHLSGLSEQDLA